MVPQRGWGHWRCHCSYGTAATGLSPLSLSQISFLPKGKDANKSMAEKGGARSQAINPSLPRRGSSALGKVPILTLQNFSVILTQCFAVLSFYNFVLSEQIYSQVATHLNTSIQCYAQAVRGQAGYKGLCEAAPSSSHLCCESKES